MYTLIEYGDHYLKTPRSLWQYYRDEPFINDNGVFIHVPDNSDNASFKSKKKKKQVKQEMMEQKMFK